MGAEFGNTLTGILTVIKNAANLGISELIQPALSLLTLIFFIDLVLQIIGELITDRFNPMVFMALACIRSGGWVYLIKNWPEWYTSWLKGCLWIGAKFGSTALTDGQLTDPSALIEKGIKLAGPILDLIVAYAKTDPLTLLVSMLLLAVSYVFIVLAFIIMALQMFLTFCEFYILSAVAVMLLAFGPWQKTSFMAENAIKAMAGIGVKVITLSIVLNMVYPILIQIQEVKIPKVEDAFYFLGSVIAVALLTWLAPNMAANIMSGGSLSLGGISSSAMNAVRLLKK